MDLTPGEKGLLGQIRLLYEATGRDQPLRALTATWPPVHYESYRNAYAGLVAKRLIQDHNQTFRITDSGLQAIGVTPVVAPAAPAPRSTPRAVRQPPQAAPKAPASMMSRVFNGLFGRRA
ncbi:MAG TPA: hypothetical protein VFJ70_15320 [Burkholderiales bacterium]|nr:hypothetical protein [Burkholderiales bacterium]